MTVSEIVTTPLNELGNNGFLSLSARLFAHNRRSENSNVPGAIWPEYPWLSGVQGTVLMGLRRYVETMQSGKQEAAVVSVGDTIWGLGMVAVGEAASDQEQPVPSRVTTVAFRPETNDGSDWNTRAVWVVKAALEIVDARFGGSAIALAPADDAALENAHYMHGLVPAEPSTVNGIKVVPYTYDQAA